jgi:tRNA pseudouridine13 synthase
MFIHSYQSYIWNKAASFRIQEGGGMNVCTGDLVLVNGHEVSHDDNVEGKGKSNKTDYSSSGLKGKEVVVVSEADIRDERFTIEDVVLPLVGTKIQYPKNSTGDYYDILLTQDSLSKADFVSIEDKDLSACGDYRKLICKPKDVDFKVKLYKDPIQPLIQTDLMKVQNVELECIDLDATLADTPDSKQLEQLIVGMIVGFSLPPSAYATIALRELMKRPTAGEYQAQLMLEGDCERNVGKDFK